MAAIASALLRPPEDDEPASTAPAPSATARPAADTPEPVTLEFPAGARPRTRELEVDRAATVLVDVETPSEVDIPSLGLTEPAEPLTPALFEVLADAPGSHPILVQPAGSEGPPSRTGTLKAIPARP